jgi:hypothetical protein
VPAASAASLQQGSFGAENTASAALEVSRKHRSRASARVPVKLVATMFARGAITCDGAQ